jgi:hypothetical protein
VKFAKYLPQEGWQPVIYTPENPEYTAIDHTLEAEIPHSVEIIRRPITEPYDIYRKLMGKGASTDMKTLTAGASGGAVTEISSGRKSFKQRLSLWIRGNLFVPDPRVGWVKPSVRFLKKYLAEHPVDVIVTTGPPHSMLLIGQRLQQGTRDSLDPRFPRPVEPDVLPQAPADVRAHLAPAPGDGAVRPGRLFHRAGGHATGAGRVPGADENARGDDHERL